MKRLMALAIAIILLMIALILVYDTYVDSEPINESAWLTSTSIAAKNTASIEATLSALTDVTKQ